MTFKQIVKKLERNVIHYNECNDIDKLNACVELIKFINDNEFQQIKGHVKI